MALNLWNYISLLAASNAYNNFMSGTFKLFFLLTITSVFISCGKKYRLSGAIEDRYRDRAELRKVIEENKNDLRDCYLNEDLRNSLVPKQVEVVFKVFPDGKVRNAIIKTQVNHRLYKCLVKALENIEYPEIEEYVVLNVNQTINLIP